MLELINVNQEILNTRDQITIQHLKDGLEFLENFELNRNLILDAVVIIYRLLKLNSKIPYNLYKFFIAAYYIVLRHPRAFPVHESKNKFCRKFGIKPSSLDYCVEKIISVLKIKKILDEKNYPYFLDLKTDIGFKLCKNIVKIKVERVMMNFLTKHQSINSQILTEDLIAKIIFEMEIFPEEMFRQFYEIIFELVEDALHDYYEYIHLQQKYFI